MTKKIKVKDFEKGRELLYHESKPFTGIAVITNDKGQTVSEGVYENGKRNGLFTYMQNETLDKVAEEYFSNHQLIKEIEYRPNGTKEYEKNYKNGEVHGWLIIYHDNGSEYYREKHENGYPVGEKIYSANPKSMDPKGTNTKTALVISCFIVPIFVFLDTFNTEAVGDMFIFGIVIVGVGWIVALIGRKLGLF